ncbi:MAG: uracil-DNA glycosylase [Planctomycetes bacterium]|nr:uracil-DNA glycosylase [Planctomycetota bacterium]NOG54008.1 uracil-DNA glycosylase [Planctomycetota bacterium]
MTSPSKAQAAVGPVAHTDLLLGTRSIPIPKSNTPPTSDKQSALDQLRERHDRECPHCTKATYHTQTVFGEGDPDAQMMFIGEAPGAEEDKTGRPFVGRAGKLLEKMINAMGLAREDVYIANVLKSRPPDNATPTVTEVSKCAPYLTEQIRIIQPAAIVALGAPSAKFLLQTSIGISKLRGRWHTCLFGDLEVPVMPTFHPAYLLRQYTPDNRTKVWSDLQMVMEQLGMKT